MEQYNEAFYLLSRLNLSKLDEFTEISLKQPLSCAERWSLLIKILQKHRTLKAYFYSR